MTLPAHQNVDFSAILVRLLPPAHHFRHAGGPWRVNSLVFALKVIRKGGFVFLTDASASGISRSSEGVYTPRGISEILKRVQDDENPAGGIVLRIQSKSA